MYIRFNCDWYCPIVFIPLSSKAKNVFILLSSSYKFKNGRYPFLRKIIFVLLVTAAGIFKINVPEYCLNKSIVTFNILNVDIVLLLTE